MKRLLIVLTVIAIAGAATAKYRITSGVTEGLEAAKRAMAPVATMTYGDVSTTLAGTIEITDVNFTSRIDNQQFHADRIAFVTGSPWVLLNLEETISNRQIPEQLQFLIEGLDVDVSFMNGLENDPFGETVFTRFETAGCDGRTSFDRADLAAMGYDQLTIDMSMGYRLLSSGMGMAIDIDTVSRNQVGLEVEMVINLPRPMNAGGPSAELANESSLASATMKMEDLGGQSRALSFCAEETGMNLDEYRQHHLTAWQAEWNRQGLEPSSGLLDAYQDYVAHPGSTMTFTMDPFPAIDLGSNYLSPDPVYLSKRLNPKLGTDNTGLQPVSLTKAKEAETEPSQGTEQASGHTVSQPEKHQANARTANADALSISSLGEHIKHDVRITLHSGKRLDGRILAVRNHTLKLQRFLQGGTMEIPVQLGDIKKVVLR